MKIRLYRGPFDGKILEHRDAGRNEIIIRGPRRMSRRERYEAQMDLYSNPSYLLSPGHLTPVIPNVTARYKLVYSNVQLSGTQGYASVPCYHPDGSLFYEWDQPRRKKK